VVTGLLWQTIIGIMAGWQHMVYMQALRLLHMQSTAASSAVVLHAAQLLQISNNQPHKLRLAVSVPT